MQTPSNCCENLKKRSHQVLQEQLKMHVLATLRRTVSNQPHVLFLLNGEHANSYNIVTEFPIPEP